jgi:hypothetical protein
MQIIGLDIETAKAPSHFPWRQGYYLSILSISYPDGSYQTWGFHHDDINFIDADTQWNDIQHEIDQYDVCALCTMLSLN